ncbi:MAG TPA: NHL repeat-containing protein, partial [Bacteroidia bacterium]|nr:NHL repeat-containing protein [Bacteroidia bacterium]
TATTFAGLAGFSGAADGTGGAARFHYPAGLAVDGAGNLYVADARNSTIRRITPAGVVTTLAGSPGIPGSVDGAGSDARFDHPQGIALDAAGNLYVADSNNATIRKIAVDGTVTTLAGTAQSPGSSDGTGAAARFRLPAGLVVDATGNVYVADAFNHTIRRITPAGTVSTLAGLAENPGATDGLGSAARFAYPQGVTLDPAGNLYVADGGNSTIRRIDLGGQVTTVAGAAGNSGSADGAGSAARFIFPCSVAVSATSVIFVTDTYNSTIRSVTPNGMVTTFAGSADSRGSTGGTGGAARFAGPQGVAVDGAGNVYVADTHNHTVRRIAAAGVVTTLAGSPGAISADPVTGQLNGTYADGTGSAARLFSPAAVAVDGAGTVFVADTGNHIIRRITGDGVVTTFAGLAGTFGTDDGAGGAARFFEPAGLTVDSAGNLYVADTRNHTIRRITPAGVVTTLAGQALASGSADGTGSEARFNQPSGLALDGAGNLYVADSYNHTIRRVTPVGAVTTLAGLAGASGSLDGTGSAARFDTPRGLGIDRSGDLYLADSSNHTFRRITPAGVVTTLAGKNGTDGSADGIGNSARFFHPTCVALDDSGCAYVTDSFNNTIRKGQLAGPPVTTIQPQSLSVAAGAVVEFSVSAVAVPAPTY